MSTEAWVSVDAVAQHLSVAQDSIYRWIEHKRLPAHRVGRLWKFKLSQIDEWVRAGGTPSAPVAQQQPPPEQIRDRLDTMLSAAFEAEPVEDGVAHQAERILERALDTGDQVDRTRRRRRVVRGHGAARLLGRHVALSGPPDTAGLVCVAVSRGTRCARALRCGTPRCCGAGGRVVGRPESDRRSARSSRGREVACRVHQRSHLEDLQA